MRFLIKLHNFHCFRVCRQGPRHGNEQSTSLIGICQGGMPFGFSSFMRILSPLPPLFFGPQTPGEAPLMQMRPLICNVTFRRWGEDRSVVKRGVKGGILWFFTLKTNGMVYSPTFS